MTENKDIRVITSNISFLRRREQITAEQTEISLAQLSQAIAQRAMICDLRELYSDFCISANFPSLEGRARFCRFMTADARFSRSISEYLVFGRGDLPLAGTHGKIAYVRNAKVDSAYTLFSKNKRGIKAHHVSTFAEGCEAVASNFAEFCIIPIENTADGKLYTFYAMLDKYELKICTVTSVFDEDGINRTVFALAGRKIEQNFPKSSSLRFEFSVTHEDADIICDITAAVRVLGGHLSSLGTQTLKYDEIKKKYYFAVDFKTSSPTPLALFVSLEYPMYEPVGLYTIRKEL